MQQNKRILIVTLVDITAYKRIELALQKSNQQLEQLRSLDRITGLNNYIAFERKIQNLAQSDSPENIGMILIDIDHFKIYNQEHGYDYGDLAIKKISHHLEQFVENTDQELFHLGGDEFIFILSNMQRWGLYTFAEQVIAMVQQLNLYFSSGRNYRLSISLAIEEFQSGTAFDLDFFLIRLKELMKTAKLQGGNGWVDTRSKPPPLKNPAQS